MKLLSRVQLFAVPWTVTYQASPPMGFSRQECWNGLPFPSPGDLPNPGSPAFLADALPSETPGKPSIIKTSSDFCLIHLFFPQIFIIEGFYYQVLHWKNKSNYTTISSIIQVGILLH